MFKIAHIINPVNIDSRSDLHIAQPITFESMRIAKNNIIDNHSITLYSAQYAEDLLIIPPYFTKTKNLDRSVLNMHNFSFKRKLPILKDILFKLYNESDADIFIYTNVDIAVQPFFYNSIIRIIEQGYDSFTINRRTITKKYNSPHQLNSMYGEVGEPHKGHDCFIFTRGSFEKFIHVNACLGINYVGKYLLLNMIASAKKFNIFKNKHLTFHIGNDKTWESNKYLEYEAFNKAELMKLITLQLEKNALLKDNALYNQYMIQSQNNEGKWWRKLNQLWK